MAPPVQVPLLISVIVILAHPAMAAEHWAYQPPVDTETSGEHPIDTLLESARQQAGVKTAPLAAPRRWIERAVAKVKGVARRGGLMARS